MIAITSALLATMLNLGSVPEVNHADMTCLTEAIFFESGNQKIKGKLGVGWVIKNRLDTDLFPDNICKITKQRGQFSYHKTNKKTFKESINDQQQRKQLYDSAIVAIGIMSGRMADPTGGATYFANLAIATDKQWLKGMRKTTSIQDHTFYKPLKPSVK